MSHARAVARWGALAVVGAALVGVAVWRGLADAADPARCGTLVAAGSRCCAPGQVERSGACTGAPAACPAPLARTAEGCVAPLARVRVAGGTLHAGAGDWEADAPIAAHEAVVAAFDLDAFEATASAYRACVAAGACARVPDAEPGLPVSGLTRDEARAYCAFQGGRLPTADEWTWANAGPKARRYAWGDTGAVCRRAAFGLVAGACGFGARGPELAGTHPDGASPEGANDLAGNVAEWVAGEPAALRGGSYASGLATELRSWHVRVAAPGARPADAGVRCAYDVAGAVLPSAPP